MSTANSSKAHSLAQLLESMALQDMPAASAETIAKLKAEAEREAQAKVEAAVRRLYAKQQTYVEELREIRKNEKIVLAAMAKVRQNIANVLMGKEQE